MALNTTSLIRKPWRVKLNIDGTMPFAVKVKLRDLLYESGSSAFRYSTGNFLKLEHDIILYYNGIYLSTGSIDTDSGKAGTTYEYWKRYGMDIGVVHYDKRAKNKFIANNAYKTQYYETKNINGYFVYDSDAALYPSGLDQFNVAYGSDTPPWHDPDAIGASDYPFQPLVSVGIRGEVSANACLILSDSDTVFDATLTTKDGYKAYSGLCLNPANRATWAIVQYVTGKTATEATNPKTGDIETLKEYYSISANPALETAEVWLRCSWFADYVSPDEFAQDLNPEASVRHRNLMISASGDFNRYDEVNNGDAMSGTTPDDVKATKSTATRPYIPITTPAVDLLSDKIVEGYTAGELENTMRVVIDNSMEADSNIGSIPTEPIDRADASIEHTANDPVSIESLVPLGYFDPESRMKSDEYDHKPVIMPKDGNGIFDGRVVSPTIDEIWVMIKKMIEGRVADASADETDFGSPVSGTAQRVIDKDVRIPAMTNFAFTYEDESKRIGNPLNHTIVSSNNGNTLKLRTTEFINSPEGFKYSTYGNIKRLDKQIVAFNANRAIAKFPPWNSITDGDTSVVVEGQMILTGDWSPRKNPLSLRELESRVMNAKYNIIANFRFLKENFAITGGLGKRMNTGDLTKAAGGSLYQMHRDYNMKIDDPNTVYNPDGVLPEGKAVSPVGETFGIGLKKETDTDYYGASAELPDANGDFGSADVYMAADGTWRYLFDHVRLPILDETY